MKRKMSVKLRLTLWFTAFMAIIAVVCLALILIITGNISRRDASEKLDSAVRTNIANLEYSSGKLNLKSGFEFYRDDVYTVIYNNSRSVLGGETPHGFDISEPLENGVIKNVYGDGDSFTVFDLFVPSGWDDGVWVRGIMLTPDIEVEALKSVRVFGLMLPFIILLAAAGGYLMIRRAMRPIERLTRIADSISDGKDLKYDIPEELEGYDETGRLARAFRLMVGRLEESFEAEKQFVSDASHELRTPTAVIGTQCDYLDKYADSVEDYKEGVEVIRRQNDRMRKLIERLLDMTRLDFGTKKLELKDTDLSELFNVLCDEQDTKDRGISVIKDIEPGIHAEIDAYLFSGVINNLLSNARKYGRDGGIIKAGLHRDGDCIKLSVSDDGIGIAKEDIDRIWRRFYQVSPSRETGSGLGLGLSMARQIVKLHGGSIDVESEPGKGSTFTVTI